MVGAGRYSRDDGLQTILDNTIVGIVGSDWFSRNTDTRLGPVRALAGYSEADRTIQEGILADMIRKHNLAVQLANTSVSIVSSFAQVHPKVIDSGPEAGRFPRDFEVPKKLEWFGTQLDNTALDRILAGYDISARTYDCLGHRLRNLPWCNPNLRIQNQDPAFLDKLLILFEYLGVDCSDLGRLDGERERDMEIDMRLGFADEDCVLGRPDESCFLPRRREARLGGTRLLPPSGGWVL